MRKNTLSVLILISGILASGAIISLADAQATTPGDIQYPILELGNCKNKDSCKVFCDNVKNSDACLTFAEQHNLMSPEELANAKKFKDNGMTGPGGCKGKDQCDQYCSDPAHIDECITFAEKNGLMSGEELNEAKKVQAAIARGIKPPACGGKEACDAYCSASEHMEECMNFSIEAGIMDPQKLEESKKVLAAIKQGIKPPACRGKDECDQYCGTHMEECMTFSLAAGMVPDDQKEQMQKTLEALKRGIKPPACRGPEECDKYCADPGHIEECVKFSVAVGNMTEQQAQTSIKNGGKGPGGCIGRDACETFCNNPDNQEICFNFGRDNGMIPPEDLQKMQEGQQRMKDSFSQMPPEVLDCLSSTVGADVVEKMKNGSMMSRKAGDSIGQCFQKFSVREGTPNGNGPGSDQSGQPDQNQNNQDQQNQQGQNQFQNDLKCSPKGTVASFVCAKNGRNANTGGPETTYFNSCTAKQAGAEIIHEGVCEGHNPCGSVADPVCGNDGNTWVSACYADESGGGVKYEGVCRNPSGQQNTQQSQQRQNQQGQSGDKFQPGPGTKNPGGQQMPQQAGPGGCKGPEECKAYCESHQEECKNFQPSQNQQSQPNQPSQQMQPEQRLPQQQPGQPDQGVTNVGPCGTGPGTCSGIGPDDINQQSQPGQMQPQIQQQEGLPPPSPVPSSFLPGTQELLANILDAFR